MLNVRIDATNTAMVAASLWKMC